MNRKKAVLFAILSLSYSSIFAGGILTNTNQSAHFARMMAREASTQIDAAYTNPAGLVKLNDGFHISFSNQSAYQTRKITTTFAPFAGFGGSPTKEFKGNTSAPLIPSLQAAYKKGPWVFSMNLAITGGGGKATFNHGLPSFEAPIALMPLLLTSNTPSIKTTQYSVDAYMRGSSLIYGVQFGGSYAINDMFSVYGGFRLNIVNNGYEGYMKDIEINPITQANPTGELISAPQFFTNIGKNDLAAATSNREIDNKQSGWGVAPIIGLNFNNNGLNIGMKYEFKTALDVESKTINGKDGGLAQFKNGVNTPHDIPALFSAGVSYQFLPKLSASLGYHHFFDSDAKMADGKEKFIDGGTNEYLAGIEYRIDRIFLVSAGGQITRYGVTDDFQKDLSFSLNSYSIGFGGAANISEKVVLNVGYFWTTYSDWEKKYDKYVASANIPGTDVFSRTNRVFAIGVDISF